MISVLHIGIFTSPILRERIVVEKLQQIDTLIKKNRDFSRAYVYQESTGQFILKASNYYGKGNSRNRARIMKERLCKLFLTDIINNSNC